MSCHLNLCTYPIHNMYMYIYIYIYYKCIVYKYICLLEYNLYFKYNFNGAYYLRLFKCIHILLSDETQKISMVPQLMIKKSSFDDIQDNNWYERDYVKPVKSIPESLHAHDILYGGDQNQRKFIIKHTL